MDFIEETKSVHERRNSSRISTKGWLLDNGGQAARLIDISLEGARVEFIGLDEFEIDVSSCVIMPVLGVKKEVEAVAMWQRRTDKPGGLEVGISFDKGLGFYA